MAEVSYTTSTSVDQPSIEESVEIVGPKSGSISHSIESENDLNLIQLGKQSNRPSVALWRQQKLPAWQPILTADTVLPAFFLLSIALIPIGAGLLVSSNYVQEISYDYTDCLSTDGKTKCLDIIGTNNKWSIKSKCECIYNFTISDQMKAPVFFYYGLSNYFQNHRRYAKSRDDRQLNGKDKGWDLSEDCQPFDKDKNGRKIVPCGAIANSLFTDTYKLFHVTSDDTLEPIELAQTHIAWPTDKLYKFNNPADGFDPKSSPPPLWGNTHINDLDPNHPGNNGFDNEHLIVWMRTAAFPTFRKLWARVDHDQNILWREGLPKGKYQISIQYNYPVKFSSYTAGKYIYISNTSWLGGKNTFLGYAYITVGIVCLILWLLFFILSKKYGQNGKDIVDIDRRTHYMFKRSKKVDDSGDETTRPLKPAKNTVTFSQNTI